MSTFHGPQHKGAMRAHRERLRKDAELRQSRAFARRLIAEQVADTSGPTIPDTPSSTPERTTS